jgi:hypothetical protein
MKTCFIDYKAPCCIETDLCSEGILCLSGDSPVYNGGTEGFDDLKDFEW